MKKTILFFSFLVLLTFDFITKSFFKNTYENFDYLFGLRLPKFFGFLIVGCMLIYVLLKITEEGKNSFFRSMPWLFIFTGGLANFLERLWRGSVRDIFYFFGSIWNLADLYVIFGVLLILFCDFKSKKFL